MEILSENFNTFIRPNQEQLRECDYRPSGRNRTSAIPPVVELQLLVHVLY